MPATSNTCPVEKRTGARACTAELLGFDRVCRRASATLNAIPGTWGSNFTSRSNVRRLSGQQKVAFTQGTPLKKGILVLSCPT